MKVYVIDDLLTAIETVLGAYAKGYNIREDFTFVPCYVAMDGVSLAHGKTLKDAFRDARAKELEDLPENERVNRFVTEHPDPEENLPNEELFTLYHVLTGSCEFGRREFCKVNGIDLEGSMSVSKFLALTKNEFGGSVIKKIEEKYPHKAETGTDISHIFAKQTKEVNMAGCATIALVIFCIILIIVAVGAGTLAGVFAWIGDAVASVDVTVWVILGLVALVIGIVALVNS